MPQPPTETLGPLAEALVALAGTPDDASGLDAQLQRITQLAADRIPAVAYASVTVDRADAYTTVAVSSELALAVDKAQYADDDGPCLESLQKQTPVIMPDISRTMAWPGFRQTAASLGLATSVSIPLFAGSGTTVAALNLYGHDTAAMAPLIAKLLNVYDLEQPTPAGDAGQQLDEGSDDLLTGLTEALTVRATIQLAIGAIMARTRTEAESAYLKLRVHAATTGVPLLAAATMLISQGL